MLLIKRIAIIDIEKSSRDLNTLISKAKLSG
jgi:hypothetical protein